MALHTKQQLADLCGVTKSNITTYVTRKNLVTTDGKYFDDQVEPNASFIKKRLVRQHGGRQSEPNPVPEKIAKPRTLKQDTSQQKKEESLKNHDLYDLELEQKRLNLQAAQIKVDLDQIKKDKLNGLLIPTEMVIQLFPLHFKSVQTAFTQAADNVIVKISHKKALSREETATLRKELVDIVNAAVADSIKESMRDVKKVVSNYSEKREVGEHD